MQITFTLKYRFSITRINIGMSKANKNTACDANQTQWQMKHEKSEPISNPFHPNLIHQGLGDCYN